MWAGRKAGDVHTDGGGDEGRDLSGDHEQLPDDGRSAELVSQGVCMLRLRQVSSNLYRLVKSNTQL